MNIQPISSFNSRFAFKSIRTDKNTVSQLKKGDKPIVENNRQNIYAALNNLSAQPNRGIIEFLLDVADNQAYGQGKNTEFKSALDADGVTPEDRENTDWTQLLADTIKKSMSDAEEDVSDLETEYDRIFNQTKPLTEEQKNILDLRKNITEQICSPEMIQDEEDLERVTDIRKNLDYFVASSEVSTKEKQDCLGKFVYLLSDDYNINEQLKDRKLQVLDEILNDITVKTPEDEILKTKAIDQRATGMCAAISIARKMMAYEDKARYTDLVLQELNSSKFMDVYDITELGSDKKVSIPKAIVDYNTATAKGYRITDSAVHIWMNAAHASGDGSIQTETYIPFDATTYGIFDDASWYNGLPEQSRKFLLMSLIKENQYVNSAMKSKKFISESSEKIRDVKRDAAEGQSAAYSRMEGIFSGIFPDKKTKEIRTLTDSVIEFYTGKTDGAKLNVPGKFSKEQKNNLISEFLEKKIPGMSDEQKTAVKEKSDDIRQMTEEYTGYDSNIKSLKKFETPRGRFSYNKRLFNAAAAHRLALEADLDLDDGVVRFERKSGLPPRHTQIMNYLYGLKNNLGSESVRSRFLDKKGNIQDEKKLRNQLDKDILSMDTEIPSQINAIIEKLTGENFTTVMSQMYTVLSAEIQNGNEQVFSSVADTLNLKKDKTIVVKHLQKTAEQLANNPTSKQKDEAVRMLGYEDEVQLATEVMSSFFDGLNKRISKEDYERLTTTFGGADKLEHGLNLERTKFNSTVKKYAKILDRWQIPGARELIMKKLEKDNFVLSTENLDALYAKFNDIQAQRVKNESIENAEERHKADDELFKFDENEKVLFDKIENALPSMKKYAKVTYQNVNKLLKPLLDEQYANIGMLNGQFWVREEGSSGLSGNEQIRIIEQMTGKPYHLEYDVQTAVKEMKKGNGNGILSMSVDDGDYAFHAQYVPAVTSERLTDPLTGKEQIKDIIWTDNSWGRAEKDSYWSGGDGFLHTDYGQGLGFKHGFMVTPDYKTGLPVDEIDGALGHSARYDEDFGLFSDFVMPGTPVDTYQKLYKMFNYIFTMGADEQLYNDLENAIVSGTAKIDLKHLTGVDDVVAIRTENLYSRLDKEIKSEEDFEKLPEDDELKFTFEKLALYFSTIDTESREDVLSANTPEELKEVEDQIIESQVAMFGSILGKSDVTVKNIYAFSQSDLEDLIEQTDVKFGEKHEEKEITDIFNTIFFDKDSLENLDGPLSELEAYFVSRVDSAAETFFKDENARKQFADGAKKIISGTIDENLRIKSLDAPIIKNSPLQEQFFAAIDRAYEPESDEEMLAIIQELQEASFEDANEFCDVLEDEELGLNFRPAYDYVKKFKAEDSAVRCALGDVIASNVLNGELAKSENEDESTPEELYRSLYIKISELDVQKFIKSYKAEAFQKYKVREAFPEPVVVQDETIAETAYEVVDNIKEIALDIQNKNAIGDVLEAQNQFNRRFNNTKLLSDIKDGKEEIKITAKNKSQIEDMTAMANSLYEKIRYNENNRENADALELMTAELQNGLGVVSGEILRDCLNQLNDFAEGAKAAGLTKDIIRSSNKELMKSLNGSIYKTVRANIDPKYQNDAINKFNKIIDAQRKYFAPEVIEELTDDFVDLFTEKHITKNPKALLNECIKMLQNGEQNTDEYQALKMTLSKVLTVAQQTKVQYKLVQNEHSGIGSKTKEMLSMFRVYLKDGQKVSLDTELGTLHLVNQLSNSENNYQTLNLFLNQTGLSKQAVRVVVKSTDFDKLKETADKQTENAKEVIGQIEELHLAINDFFEQSGIEYSSLEDCTKQVTEFVERKYGKDKGEVFADFIDYMNTVIFTKASYNFEKELIPTYFDMLKTEALQTIIDAKINSKFQIISEINRSAGEKVNLVYSVNIPENSEEEKTREDFEAKYIDLDKYLSGKYQEIKDAVANGSIIHAEVK